MGFHGYKFTCNGLALYLPSLVQMLYLVSLRAIQNQHGRTKPEQAQQLHQLHLFVRHADSYYLVMALHNSVVKFNTSDTPHIHLQAYSTH